LSVPRRPGKPAALLGQEPGPGGRRRSPRRRGAGRKARPRKPDPRGGRRRLRRGSGRDATGPAPPQADPPGAASAVQRAGVVRRGSGHVRGGAGRRTRSPDARAGSGRPPGRLRAAPGRARARGGKRRGPRAGLRGWNPRRTRGGVAMIRRRRPAALVILASAALAPVPPTSAGTEAVARAGDLTVSLATDPDPPRTGDNQLSVTLREASGKPVDGASLGFVWDMPAMGAMPEMKGAGTTKAAGGGRYVVTYPLAMGGDWYLTLAIDAPGHAHQELKMKVATGRSGIV